MILFSTKHRAENDARRAILSYRAFMAQFSWHRWFAWHPVLVGDHLYAWLGHVERRRGTASSLGASGEWEYRLEVKPAPVLDEEKVSE